MHLNRTVAAILGVLVVAAACSSAGPTPPPSNPASAPSSQAPASVSEPTAPASASVAPTAAASSATASPAAGGSVPYGKNVCDILPAATIDTTLGIHIKSHGWDGHVCSWSSTTPPGGATIGWLEPGSAFLAGSGCQPEATPVPDLGLQACATVQTGLPSPLPPTSVLMIVKLDTGGMTVHVSGTSVTVDNAVTLAKDVMGG
jgi:hypothetical protein